MFVTKMKIFKWDISYALEYFNENMKWLHADVKPENILVDFDKGIASFYLADMSCSIQAVNFSNGDQIGGTPLWMSPEMISAAYLNTFTFPSTMCIDAYGLELVAIHLYSALCQSRPGNIDILCQETKLFEKIWLNMDKGFKHFNQGIYERSEGIKRIIRSLQLVINKQPSDRLINSQIALINVLKSHLIRVPINGVNKDVEWLRSRPNECLTWRDWRSGVESV